MKEEQRIDNRIRELLENSVSLPRAPEGLVQRTALWMSLIEDGREAERQLKGLEGSGAEHDAEGLQNLSRLAAKAVIGRIATHRNLPAEGFTIQDIETVAKDPRMQDAIRNKSPAGILKDVESGTLLTKLGKKENILEGRNRQKEMQANEANKTKQNQKQKQTTMKR